MDRTAMDDDNWEEFKKILYLSRNTLRNYGYKNAADAITEAIRSQQRTQYYYKTKKEK